MSCGMPLKPPEAFFVSPPRSAILRRVMTKTSACIRQLVVVGIQTNMFPRARQLALEFKTQGATVVMGGFHISGSITMLHDGNGDSKIPCPMSCPPNAPNSWSKELFFSTAGPRERGIRSWELSGAAKRNRLTVVDGLQ